METLKPPPRSNKRLNKLYEEREALQAQIRQIENREREQDRKADTRRKILAGAVALAEKDPAFQAMLLRGLGKSLTAERDRALFALPPLPQSEQKVQTLVQPVPTEELSDFVPATGAGDARAARG